ncbi:hypothetical protein B0H13DRAFT_1923633 [Mycena leptocephala]|nr:hypothetical protein B0H13DRAFT_1923633 [Mycena leptocephala]
MSYSLINLPEHLRYCTANLLLAGIMPGPKEANPDQCQRFLRPLINELLRFPARTNTEHRRLQKEYLKCTTKSARDAFVKQNAARWCCTIFSIDVSFNSLLGVVKTHFYHIWVQLNVLRKTKELRSLHALLAKLKLPAHLGRLPSLIGEPAGGSLTADQWLVFCTIVAPLIIPQFWQEYIPEESPQELAQRRAREITAILEAKRAAAAAARQKAQAPAGKRVRRPTARAAEMDIDPDDAAGVDAGANDDSDDDSYGLNPTQQKKRKRQQQQALQSTLGQDAREPVGSELRQAVEIMYRATDDDRGTVQALARELDAAQEDAPELYFALLSHLQIRLPNARLHSFVELAPSPDSLVLEPHGILFNYVIVRHARYLASSRASHPYNSFIAVRSSAALNALTWVGELQSIVAIEQPGSKTIHRFGFMRWFRPATVALVGTVWSQFSALKVQIWDAETYLKPADCGPDVLIDLQDIASHVVRMDVVIRGQKYWATIPTGKG